METEDIYTAFHQYSQIAHDAIRDTVHDVARRVHTSKQQHRIEPQLRRISQEMTERAKKFKGED